jgi:hypothetical protein
MPKSIDYMPPSGAAGDEPIPGLVPETGERKKLSPETTSLRERVQFSKFKNPLAITGVSLLSLLTSMGCTAEGIAKGKAIYYQNRTNARITTTNYGGEIGLDNARPYKDYYQNSNDEYIGDQSPYSAERNKQNDYRR